MTKPKRDPKYKTPEPSTKVNPFLRVKPRPHEIDLRRNLHVKVLPNTKNAFRVFCIRKGVSMQEVFEEVVQRMLIADPALIKIIDELSRRKLSREFQKLSASDAESLFDIFELESPFNETEGDLSNEDDND